MSVERFDDRVAGSTRGPLRVVVFDAAGLPRDLTGDTAAVTIRPTRGGPAVATGFGNTNTPGTAGVFEFQLLAAHVARPGIYRAVVTMSIGGEAEVATFLMPIVPTTE